MTIDLVDNQSVRLSDQTVEPEPPDRIAFAVEGVITITGEMLGRFEGTTLYPSRVDMAVGESNTVAIDLANEASIRIETADVGVETPDLDGLTSGLDSIDPTLDGPVEPTEARPGAIAFTVEGAIDGVPSGTLDAIADGSPTLSSLRFALGDPVRGDGGSGTDVLVELTVLGRRIAVHRNGTLEIGGRGDATDVGVT